MTRQVSYDNTLIPRPGFHQMTGVSSDITHLSDILYSYTDI